ncbi:unnamed protein product [Pleuronectes platessa]|uniref:Uncharacterized protein n=1 Tax=Pleuronectes platessa TaxID=8262 RepID=A0A9N7Y9M6_PLEPL|nr:unnamed protein product [Pleuronectes platessa]
MSSSLSAFCSLTERTVSGLTFKSNCRDGTRICKKLRPRVEVAQKAVEQATGISLSSSVPPSFPSLLSSTDDRRSELEVCDTTEVTKGTELPRLLSPLFLALSIYTPPSSSSSSSSSCSSLQDSNRAGVAGSFTDSILGDQSVSYVEQSEEEDERSRADEEEEEEKFHDRAEICRNETDKSLNQKHTEVAGSTPVSQIQTNTLLTVQVSAAGGRK